METWRPFTFGPVHTASGLPAGPATPGQRPGGSISCVLLSTRVHDTSKLIALIIRIILCCRFPFVLPEENRGRFRDGRRMREKRKRTD